LIDAKVDTLLAVAEKKSFTKAAAELSLTQPAVSHQIIQLEKEIGAKIFLRGKNELQLTAEGKIILKYARRMKAIYENLREEVAESKKHLTRLRVGITHTSESNEVAEALARYSNENPGIAITIITDTTKNLYDMLDSYEIDLSIVDERPSNQEFHSLMLDTDYLVCVMSCDNPLAKKSMVTLNDLRREKLILRLPKSETRNLFKSHLQSINESLENFNVILEVDNIATIKDCIRKDLGISILAKSACMDELRKGKIAVRPIENLSMARETNIVYHKDFAYTDILQGILKIYQNSISRNR